MKKDDYPNSEDHIRGTIVLGAIACTVFWILGMVLIWVVQH